MDTEFTERGISQRQKAIRHKQTLERRKEHLERRAHGLDDYTGRSWDLSEIAALKLAIELIGDYIAERENP